MHRDCAGMHHKSRLSERAWKVQRSEVSSAFRGSLAWGYGPGSVCVHACVSQKDLGARRGPRRCSSKARGDTTNHGATTVRRAQGPLLSTTIPPFNLLYLNTLILDEIALMIPIQMDTVKLRMK